MPTGVIINASAVLLGGLFGGFFGNKLSEEFKEKINMRLSEELWCATRQEDSKK